MLCAKVPGQAGRKQGDVGVRDCKVLGVRWLDIALDRGRFYKPKIQASKAVSSHRTPRHRGDHAMITTASRVPGNPPAAACFLRGFGLDVDAWQTEVLDSRQQRLLVNTCRKAGK